MLNDIYRITLIQTYGVGGQELRNVFYYKQITPGGTSEGAEALMPAFQTQVFAAIDAIQNAIIFTVQIRVENVVPGTDNATLSFGPSSEPGERVGECLPPYACWAFRLNRSSTAVRNGQKRFAGVSEGDQGNGQAAGPFVPTLNACAAALDDIIGGPPPAVATYQPRIFRAGRPSRTIPAKTIPAMVQADFDIENAQFVSVSTQNTRKFNVGS